jgi:hypothetical protein
MPIQTLAIPVYWCEEEDVFFELAEDRVLDLLEDPPEDFARAAMAQRYAMGTKIPVNTGEC